MNFFSSYWYPICFLISGILLLFGAYLHANLLICSLAVAMFAIWDIWFILSSDSFTGRDANFTIQQVVQARSYISYFIPFKEIIFPVMNYEL